MSSRSNQVASDTCSSSQWKTSRRTELGSCYSDVTQENLRFQLLACQKTRGEGMVIPDSPEFLMSPKRVEPS